MDALLADRLKALGHPARLEILRVLAARGTCVCGEVVKVMPLSQATVSQHLKVLKEAGLIRGRIDGKNSCYCLDPRGIGELRAALDGLLGELSGAAWTTAGIRAGDRKHEDRGRDPGAGARALRHDRARRGDCCAPASCGCGDEMAPDGLNVIGDAYAGVAGRLAEADLNLGCGVPTRHAALRPGETVLDLGSGAGNDAFIARHEVGPEGRVLGVDMTAEMIAKARGNAAKLGYDNVEFREGQIEQMPVDAGSIDVVISNCVLNLVPDKGRAFAEMFRVLRPGGRFCVSDIVATGELPAPVREVAALYVGCVAGAMAEERYLALLETTGFEDVRVAEAKPIALSDEALAGSMSAADIAAFRASGVTLKSVTVLGTKPAS